MTFLTISNENIFFKIQGARLGMTLTPKKGLKWVLISIIYLYNVIIYIYIYIHIYIYKIYNVFAYNIYIMHIIYIFIY